ncbi:MAG: cupin domain-containing protein [Chloroflexi bacterium]|nr:cupin domain-containing protein [Chloroflexota bacterium]
MPHEVTLIPGDGIGPEVTAAARRVLDASGVAIQWHEHPAGQAALEAVGTPLPDSTLAAITRTGVALKGPTATPVGSGFRSVNVALRQALQLYANLRPIRSFRGIRTPFEDVDLIIIRENTEDLYLGIEHPVDDLGAVGFKITTRKGSERIARFAFEYAKRLGRRLVTAVHKANIFSASDGLFLAGCRRIAGHYPEIAYQERLVDNLAAQMIRRPRDFDLLLLPNLYGDIYSDLCAGLVGGLGVAPGANIGEHGAIFEAVHGTAPDIAGKNLANPTAMILSGVMLLEYLGEFEAASRVTVAVEAVLAEGRVVTRDLGGQATTTEMTEAICRQLTRPHRPGRLLLDEQTRVADVLRAVAATSREGPVWSAAADEFAVTAVVYPDGHGSSAAIASFDQLIIVLEGEGAIEIAGERYPLHPGKIAHVPRGVRWQVRAEGGRLVYLAVHRHP